MNFHPVEYLPKNQRKGKDEFCKKPGLLKIKIVDYLMIAFIFLEIKTSITQKLLNLKKIIYTMTKRDSIDTFHLFHDIMYNSVCISYNIHK
jgi:hypothetical protein